MPEDSRRADPENGIGHEMPSLWGMDERRCVSCIYMRVTQASLKAKMSELSCLPSTDISMQEMGVL